MTDDFTAESSILPTGATVPRRRGWVIFLRDVVVILLIAILVSAASLVAIEPVSRAARPISVAAADRTAASKPRPLATAAMMWLTASLRTPASLD